MKPLLKMKDGTYSEVEARKKGDVSRKAPTAAPNASSQKLLKYILLFKRGWFLSRTSVELSEDSPAMISGQRWMIRGTPKAVGHRK